MTPNRIQRSDSNCFCYGVHLFEWSFSIYIKCLGRPRTLLTLALAINDAEWQLIVHTEEGKGKIRYVTIESGVYRLCFHSLMRFIVNSQLHLCERNNGDFVHFYVLKCFDVVEG